ncbi:hypothetical protein JCM31826_05180 [Thermaurantimonas aggregans]|uniref:Sensor of ECF-type sigma factor n=1 Tax=Thermaurantimonas aggregans TaxID=2173829 RepID=A0A401XJ60_9FLAO|nr:hypothetical protein [Thermaurantimonas aggregans]MCX8148949.1 hypothetical protein [Thermaurantimonas aggregans]GCD77036.1 hypothetical protein JCM31826_05180 [Thermaurantimonas aggregans]
MAKRIVALTVLLMSVLCAGAQHDKIHQKARTRIENMRIAIITSRLDLTTEESEKFWPLYNEYRKKIDKLHQDRMELIDRKMQSDSVNALSDGEAEKVLSSILKINDEYARVQNEYYKRFQKLLGSRRALELYRSEVQFKRAIVRELREMPERRAD